MLLETNYTKILLWLIANYTTNKKKKKKKIYIYIFFFFMYLFQLVAKAAFLIFI